MKGNRTLLWTVLAASTLLSCAPAFALVAPALSDWLQLGDQPKVYLYESQETAVLNPISDVIYFAPISGVFPNFVDQITLTEPDSTAVSDYINVDPIYTYNSDNVPVTLYGLNVTLVSDNDSKPWDIGYGNTVLPETGLPQNLTPYIETFYGVTGLPSVVVESDVPEASTWAMLLVGFAGLGFAARRATRTATAIG